jgi:hypothetical protein
LSSLSARTPSLWVGRALPRVADGKLAHELAFIRGAYAVKTQARRWAAEL